MMIRSDCCCANTAELSPSCASGRTTSDALPADYRLRKHTHGHAPRPKQSFDTHACCNKYQISLQYNVYLVELLRMVTKGATKARRWVKQRKYVSGLIHCYLCQRKKGEESNLKLVLCSIFEQLGCFQLCEFQNKALIQPYVACVKYPQNNVVFCTVNSKTLNSKTLPANNTNNGPQPFSKQFRRFT